MKKLAALAVASALGFTLAACTDEPSPEAAPASESTTTTSSSPKAVESPVETTPSLVDPGEEVGMSEIGKELGFDCAAYGDCSVFLTVEDIQVLDSCPGEALGSAPEGTQLVRIPVLLETKPSDYEFDPSGFAIWSEWSVLTEEGINQPLPRSSWCYNPRNESDWSNRIRVGDTVRHVHLADIPLDATEIRLTEDVSGGRFIFPAP
ncbi:hypothetical protein [Corynebacterium glutamicum]|uniref:hypothetical protein n=1 Tax=Corynebacterium glutamicum TaxID=1718 RepID=UPI00146903EC|nr:hypothetical protein [Corynebacterium glutamicum]GFK18912.1 hypothetical protein KbCgl_14840 [Corynebacterium glutamicum]